ncbi:MAG: NfeD family protein [Eubacteriales bacterium]|nr:NfeD family protein [Eubacteriales bacterium]
MTGKIRKVAAVAAIILIGLALSPPAQAERQGPVFVVPLTGDIDSALPASMKLAFADASKAQAKLIILNIDTFGGLVDASDRIKTIIYDSSIPVYAYVKKAISGGAYVALACDRIYMHPGGTLGAVEPVAGGQPVTDEKHLSVIEGQLRSMAERQGRDPQIASAMVRKEIAIPKVVEEGKLLTLTAKMAAEVGYAEGIVAGYEEIPELAGINSADFIIYKESWSIGLARFLSNPYVAAVLLAIGLAGLAIELFTAGFGVAGIISLIAFALYFGGNLFVGFARSEYIILFILGIVLLGAEVFTAGFGILGIGGLACVAVSIVLSAATLTEGLLTLGLALFLSVIIVVIAFRFLRKSPLWNKLILSDAETKERGYVGPKDLNIYLGAEGVAMTPLRPSGTVQLADGAKFDALTQGNYLAVGTEVVVIGFSSGAVVVTEK